MVEILTTMQELATTTMGATEMSPIAAKLEISLEYCIDREIFSCLIFLW